MQKEVGHVLHDANRASRVLRQSRRYEASDAECSESCVSRTIIVKQETRVNETIRAREKGRLLTLRSRFYLQTRANFAGPYERRKSSDPDARNR